MTMTPFNGDIAQSLKWLQNKAPNIQSLVGQKKNWYNQFHESFWTNWETNVFDLKTANPFGIMVWCIILDVPASVFGLYVDDAASWAYGPNRQNFIYSGLHVVPDPNTLGGNFFGGGSTTILNIDEARKALMLRYVALICNGRISFINRMLRYIFNDDQPWDFPGKKYFYVTDLTGRAQTLTPTPPINDPFTMEYRIGANMNFSAQFINLLNSPQFGIAPTVAGSKYTVIQEA